MKRRLSRILRNLVTMENVYPLSVYYAFKQQDAGFMSGRKVKEQAM